MGCMAPVISLHSALLVNQHTLAYTAGVCVRTTIRMVCCGLCGSTCLVQLDGSTLQEQQWGQVNRAMVSSLPRCPPKTQQLMYGPDS
jgi:hypothetical protein